MQVTNLEFHNYDREIKRMLDRLNGVVPVYQKVSKQLNRAKDYSAISPKNKELLFRVYHDLIKRTNFRPIGYFAPNPIKDYLFHLKKLKTKFEKGEAKIKAVIENSIGQTQEVFLLKKDDDQQKLFSKQTRTILKQSTQLIQIKNAAEEQLRLLDKQRFKNHAIYK
jgi:hypothetical protein